MHQGDEQFGQYKGVQCTAIVIYSMFYSLSNNINSWNSQNLDTILYEGCELYKDVLEKNQIPLRYLGVDDILGAHSFYGIDFVVEKYVMFNNTIQLLDDNNNDLNLDFVHDGQLSYENILNQIKMFFASNCSFALFICNLYSYGLIKYQNRIYFYDSHAKLLNGDHSNLGKSSLRTFNTLNDLCNYIVKINRIQAYYQLTYLNVRYDEIKKIENNSKLLKSFSNMSIDNEPSKSKYNINLQFKDTSF